MNTVVVVKQGRDAKLYPAEPLTPAERNRLRWLAHRLHCDGGLSVRQVQATMLESYGVRRSIGAIFRDLAKFECPRCADRSPEPEPAPQEPEPVRLVIYQAMASGYLTGQLRDG